MIVCWPYVTLNPLHNLFDAIVVMVKYPWNDQPVLFAGQMYRTLHLPRRYAPTWLVIGSPPAVVICAGAGGLVVCVELIRHKIIEARIAVICLALLFPLGLIVGLHATVFDTLRHFLFVIPPLLLVEGYVACMVKVNPVSVSSVSDAHTNACGSSRGIKKRCDRVFSPGPLSVLL